MYNEHFFKRSSNVTEGEDSLGNEEIQIVQVGRSFYVTDEHLKFDGERSISDNMLTISNGSDKASYEVNKLNQQELFAFYQPEIRPIILLLSFYVGLLFIAAFFQYGKSLMLQKAANRIIQKMRTD
ncbi:hypothetical protein CHH61_22985, partial [Shouchella clausii]